MAVFWRKVDKLGMVELVFFLRDWDPMGFITILQQHFWENGLLEVFSKQIKQICVYFPGMITYPLIPFGTFVWMTFLFPRWDIR